MNLLIAAIMCLSSCVTSLHPLVTYDKSVADERIEGKWQGKEQDFKVQAIFKSDLYKKYKAAIDKDLKEKDTKEQTVSDSVLYANTYVVEYERDGVRYDLLANMTRINGQLYMNFTPIISNLITDPATDVSMDPGSSINSYIIARISFINASEIKFEFLDGGFIYDQVKAGRVKINHESDDLYDTFLITASSQELRQFIEKYGNDSRLYSPENSVTLTRKS